MNSIKDLLASVKCCISSDVYMKDLSIRYGNVSTGILYDAIVNRILYSVLSNIEYYDSDNIIGLYEVYEISVNGTVITDGSISVSDITIDTETVDVEISALDQRTWTYVKINDDVVYFLDNDGNQWTCTFENDILTIEGENNSIPIILKAEKIDQCFDHDDICRAYDRLNNKCKTC